jgi:hypothetical protein
MQTHWDSSTGSNAMEHLIDNINYRPDYLCDVFKSAILLVK